MLLVALMLAALAVLLTAAWLPARAFWKRSQFDGLEPPARRWHVGQLVLLAVAFFFVAYVLTAAFMLPWSKGMCKACYSASEKEWRHAHLLHDLVLLGLAGLSAAVAALQHQRGGAALCWLAGCGLVVGGFSSQRYGERWARLREELEEARRPDYSADSLGYVWVQRRYRPDGTLAPSPTRLPRRVLTDRAATQPPVFPGGVAALRVALAQRICYPPAARGRENQLEVTLDCLVQPDGQLTVLNVNRRVPIPPNCVGVGYEAEAVRAVLALPPFTPARQHGQAVAVIHALTVEFRPSQIRYCASSGSR